MPLTPNGKVDRRALPRGRGGGHRERAFGPPETETERRLAAIFAGVLGLERVGRDDNFFDLGGNSLLITRLLVRIRAEFHRELPATEIFQSPRVAMVARKLDGAGGARWRSTSSGRRHSTRRFARLGPSARNKAPLRACC